MNFDWVMNFDAPVTLCDTKGVIVQLNAKSAASFQKDGGINLIGQNLLDCHPEPSRSILVDLLENPRVNAYTVEKNGKRKMVYQAPWFDGGQYAGLVEISLPLPDDVPHHVRS